VLFDLDDTLIVEEAFARESLAEAVSVMVGAEGCDDAAVDKALAAIRSEWYSGPHHLLCLDLGIASWEGLWATFEGSHAGLDRLREWIPSYRRSAWNAVSLALATSDSELEAEMGRRYTQSQRRGHPVIDGAVSLVESLSSEYSLALVTNGPADIQRLKLQQTGVSSRFGSVVISGEAGVGKPDPRAFAAALSELDVDPTEALMVGDSWERDVQGAIAAGLRAVWIARGRSAPGSDHHVEQVNLITELPRVL
jgi:phosphoserine phosphatase